MANVTRIFKNSDDKIIDELICHVEWSAAETDSESTGQNIEETLISHGKTDNVAQAKQLYQRLFLTVFKILCQPGQKRLTVELREDELTKNTLSETDRQILIEVQRVIDQHAKRIDVLEETVHKLNSDFVTTLAIKEQLPSLNIESTQPTVTPPTLPDNVAQKNSTVIRFVQEVSNATWIAIHGDNSSGKTTFAALVAKQLKKRTIWISIETGSIEYAIANIERILSMIRKPNHDLNRDNWYDELCSSLNPDTIFVIDNIPDLVNNTALSIRLSAFCKACYNNNVLLITTSAYPLSLSTLNMFEGGIVVSTTVPSFSNDDVIEFMQGYGAPPDFFSRCLYKVGLPKNGRTSYVIHCNRDVSSTAQLEIRP